MDIVVLASGQGSNLRALVAAMDAGQCDVRIAAVISDREGAPALEFAAARGITTRVVAAKAYADRAAWDRDLAEAIAGFAPGLVVLAGFMRIVGSAVLARCAG